MAEAFSWQCQSLFMCSCDKQVWLESPRCLPSHVCYFMRMAGLRWDWDWSAYILNDHFRVVRLLSWRVIKYPYRRIFKDSQAETARLLTQSQAPRTPLPPHSLVKRSRPPQIQREENLWPSFYYHSGHQ